MMLPAKRLIKRAKRSSLTRQRSGALDAFASPPPAHALARKRGVSEPTVLSTPYRLRKVPYPPLISYRIPESAQPTPQPLLHDDGHCGREFAKIPSIDY